MTRCPQPLLALFLLSTAFTVPGTALAQHDHSDHAHHAEQALQLDDGKRWATDDALREGMDRVRAAAQIAGDGHEQALKLAPAINDAIGHMVQHCNLAPKADATLHVLLGRLGAAAGALVKNPHDHAALAEVASVLETYPHYFDHPGWKAAHLHAH
jgi:hypothetical protein